MWTKHDQTIRSDEIEEEKLHNENDQLERNKRTSSKVSPHNYESVELRSKEGQGSADMEGIRASYFSSFILQNEVSEKSNFFRRSKLQTLSAR